jgi:ankyrin repeat protein
MRPNIYQTLATVFITQTPKAFLLGLAVAGLLVVSGCGQSQESARKELAALKLEFDATDFLFSAAQGDKTAVALFLKAGMDVNTKEENGATALIFATVKKQPEIVKLLLDHGAKPDTKHNTSDQRGLTPLLMAVSGQASEIVAMLLDKKADPNLAADDGMTPLMLACGVGDVKVITLLLDAGAKVNAADADGQTALMDAAAKQHLEVVSLLLKKGADIKAATKEGATVKP